MRALAASNSETLFVRENHTSDLVICFYGLGTGYLLRGLGFATVSSSLQMKEDFFGLCYYLLQHFLETLLEIKLVFWKT